MSDAEDSRAASISRRTRQNTDAIESARDAVSKRRKLDENADFVALDSDGNSETFSNDMEDGELSDAAEHSQKQSPAPQNNASVGQHAGHPLRARSQTPPPSSIPLEAVFPEALQNFVKSQLEVHPNKTVNEVLAEHNERGKPGSKDVRHFQKVWNKGYDTHLGDWDFRKLQQTLDDPNAFKVKFSLQIKKKAAIKEAFKSECKKAPGRPQAAAALELLKSPDHHVKMSELIGRYLREHLLPDYKPKNQLNRDTRAANMGDGGVGTSAPANDDNTVFGTGVLPQNEINGGAEIFALAKDENTAFSNSVRLQDITPEEVQEQTRYFGLTNPNDLVRCQSCGDRGHMKASCPANRCAHCGSTSHFSRVCPSHQKCTRCRQRGHRAETCSRSSKEAGQLGDNCDVCGKPGHAEEECPNIWMTFNPAKPDNTPARIPEHQMVVSCYNCGRNTHWGDECPALPEFVNDVVSFDTWSKTNADRYVMKPGEEQGSGKGNVNGLDGSYDDEDDAASVGQEKSDGRGALPAHQVAMLGDWA